jgi:hypothetical protein
VSHVSIQYKNPWGEDVILEADFPMVIEHLHKRPKGVVKAFEITVYAENLHRARMKIGRWYDFGNLALFAGMLVCKWVGIKWRNWKSNPKQAICTDMVLLALGWPGDEKTTPGDLLKRIEQAIKSGELEGRELWISP